MKYISTAGKAGSYSSIRKDVLGRKLLQCVKKYNEELAHYKAVHEHSSGKSVASHSNAILIKHGGTPNIG